MPTQQEQKAIAIQFIEDLIDGILKIPSIERNNDMFLPRDILHYSWHLQNINGMVDRIRLNQLISAQDNNVTIQGYINGPFFAPFVQDKTPSTFRLSDAMYEAIPIILDKYYGFNKKLPGFIQVESYKLIRYITQIGDNPNYRVSDLVIGSLRSLLPNIIVNPLDMDNNIFTISNANGSFTFFMIVKTSNHGFSLNNINEALAQSFNVREAYNFNWPCLLVAPDSIDVEAWKLIVNARYVYHVWPLSFLRLIHGLQELTRSKGHEIVLERLSAIFPTEERYPFSSNEAIEKLTQNLQ